MTSPVVKGDNYEREVKKMFEANGYQCIRAARSHGEYDVIAYKRDRVYKKICFMVMIQCKMKAHSNKSREVK